MAVGAVNARGWAEQSIGLVSDAPVRPGLPLVLTETREDARTVLRWVVVELATVDRFCQGKRVVDVVPFDMDVNGFVTTVLVKHEV